MTTQELKENLERVKGKYLLCRFESAYPNYDFTQVCLEIISEEADLVLREEPFFDEQSQSNYCYVKFDNFRNFIKSTYIEAYDLDDLVTSRDEIEYIENFLEDKLVLIKPYFFYNATRDVFFKNGTVEDIIDCKEPKLDSYYTIPIIPTQDSYKNFIKNEVFALNSVPKSLMGKPDYLYYDGKIYKAELNTIESNDCYWVVDSESQIKEIEIPYDLLEEDNDLIYDEYYDIDFMFIKKRALVGAPVKDIKKEEFEKDESLQSDKNYGLTGIDKVINDFYSYTKSQNLCYTKNDINNFYTCIVSGQLVILAGMSGTGKTRLPLKFAEYFNMNEENNRLLFMPVSPSFIEPADVLGFFNPNTGYYISSETRLVEFLIEAEKNPDKMHMVILDEMNLAQIEFWFAPFISILEKEPNDRCLHLYSKQQECKNKDVYPASIKIGRNVIFIGTINLDETTKDISDRLIDRSYIINLKKESFMNYQAQQSQKAIEAQKYKGDLLDLIENCDSSFNYIVSFNINQLEFFDKVHILLNNIDSQKGISFRSVRNIAFYLKNKPNEFDIRLAFDFAFKQTVMKKINGSEESIGELLGYINEEGKPQGKLTALFDEYSDISDFNECRLEIRNKILELNKYGYAR